MASNEDDTRDEHEKVADGDASSPADYALANATKSDVAYFLFSNKTGQNNVELTEETVGTCDFDRNLPTKFIFHGYMSKISMSPWYDQMRLEYFRKTVLNVIYVDWYRAASTTYTLSKANVLPVAKYFTDFFIASRIPARWTHLIGYSLGAHIIGIAGRRIYEATSTKIARLTALDPAHPGFQYGNAEISPDCADFVDAIHTDIGNYGLAAPVGHVDFYPNGGCDQPGCFGKEYDKNCNHAKSTQYFVESINHVYRAEKAEFLDGRVASLSDKGDQIVFGDDVPKTARGIYNVNINVANKYPYLRTNLEIR